MDTNQISKILGPQVRLAETKARIWLTTSPFFYCLLPLQGNSQGQVNASCKREFNCNIRSWQSCGFPEMPTKQTFWQLSSRVSAAEATIQIFCCCKYSCLLGWSVQRATAQAPVEFGYDWARMQISSKYF